MNKYLTQGFFRLNLEIILYQVCRKLAIYLAIVHWFIRFKIGSSKTYYVYIFYFENINYILILKDKGLGYYYI